MREQKGLNATTFKRRASLPPEERESSASRSRIGTRAGMHPEDRPYTTTTRSFAPTTATYVETDELDEREFTTHKPSSARRYAPPPGTYVQDNTRFHVRYEAPPRQRSQPAQRYVYTDDIDEPATRQKRGKHWLFYVEVGMLVMLALWVVGSLAVNWIGNKLNNMTYSYPRTFQIDAVVGHSDSPQNPSHFIALNLNRHVEIIEFPGGDPAKAKVFLGPTLVGDNQELTPITLSFKDVTGSGKLDMLIHIQDQIIVMVNDNDTFRPAKQTDHIHL